VPTLRRQRHLLLHPASGAAGQPGREAPPPLQLLLVGAGRLGVGLRVGGAQPAPQGLAQGPDLGPGAQEGCGGAEQNQPMRSRAGVT